MDSIIPLGQKNTLAEYMILSGADNRPPMLDKDLYDSWKSRMELYMQNKEHRRMILESVEHGQLIWPTIEENGVIRTMKYAKLSAIEKIHDDCDMKATNIILQGLPTDIYSLVYHHRVAKDIWERVQLLMQGTSLTKQERECKLYDAFDKFAHIKGESLHQYYLRFTQLVNEMNIYNMKLKQFQVNTKFLNSLPPEWSKFVTNVKLVKDLHTTNFDQCYEVGIDRPDEGTDKQKVSTDKEKDSTDRPDEDDETIAQVLLNMSQAKAVSREKEKGVELKDVENIERPRPTSTRSLLTLKPLPKIDPKDKGKKKIEEDESDTESEDINETEKKFKMLAHDEEIARKMQEDWEAEAERKRLAEEEATNAALIQDFDDIKARIEADRLLALRLQEEERAVHYGRKSKNPS
ncbi:hypothetical protein Tco_0765960 [Tanacetum coccineum]